jgi:hypothetical protein
MTREARLNLFLGTLGATAVSLLVVYAERQGAWLQALTLVGVLFLVAVVLIRD